LMKRMPVPKPGCYTATYPTAQWKEVPCTTAPKRPYVGNVGGDYSANVGAPISGATGQLNVTGVTSVSDGSGPNTFSLQLNTNTFNTALCPANPPGQPKCAAWQQFVYSNSSNCASGGSCVFIQYWLLNYPPPCPTSPTIANNTWTYAPAVPGATPGCYINGQATPVPNQTAQQLSGLILTTQGYAGGQYVQVDTSNGAAYHSSDPGDLLGIGSNQISLQPWVPPFQWTIAQFNLFGDCCTKTATFNPGAKVGTALVTITTSVDLAFCGDFCSPVANTTCPSNNFTAESNNLALVPPCCPRVGPQISYTESNVAGATSACACRAGTSWDPNSGTCAPPPPVPPACTIAFSCPYGSTHAPPQYEIACPTVVDFYQSLPNTPKFPLQTAASLSGTTNAYADIVYACTTGTQTCTGFSIDKEAPDWCGGPPPPPHPVNPEKCCQACREAGGTCTVGPEGCICQ
jgi:hypothetical protein